MLKHFAVFVAAMMQSGKGTEHYHRQPTTRMIQPRPPDEMLHVIDSEWLSGEVSGISAPSPAPAR
jgi:hypothetical protein